MQRSHPTCPEVPVKACNNCFLCYLGRDFLFFPGRKVGFLWGTALEMGYWGLQAAVSEKHHLNTSAQTTPALSLPPAPSSLEAQKLSRGKRGGHNPTAGSPHVWAGRQGGSGNPHVSTQQHVEKTLFDTYMRVFLVWGWGFFCFVLLGRAGS